MIGLSDVNCGGKGFYALLGLGLSGFVPANVSFGSYHLLHHPTNGKTGLGAPACSLGPHST